jgi:hypothetical protein
MSITNLIKTGTGLLKFLTLGKRYFRHSCIKKKMPTNAMMPSLMAELEVKLGIKYFRDF